MKKLYTILLGTLVAIFCVTNTQAQEKEEGKINIKITREVDGKTEVFEKSYNSREEMMADPEYKDFAGDDTKFHFKSDRDEDIFIEIDRMNEDDEPFSFRFFDNNQNFNWIDEEEMREMEVRIRKEMDSKRDEIEKSLKKVEEELNKIERQDLVRELEEVRKSLESEMRKVHRNHIMIELDSDLKVEEVAEDDFGKKGKVKPEEELKLEDLSFYPNPSSDRLKLRFKIDEEGPLSVRVYDFDGKTIFETSYERFSGIFHETIDMQSQDAGMYLLEIKSGNKRTTKKIVKDK
jgi:hypothetical protein